ncbi:uncharacterized protein sS8_2531 [Methylocaldum marinum]|uniref:Uncharacterized protein n=2 Tax=Methylocaldum marinum TaxID=1432792 RepID=A0A250KS32_9GAMM|nr:uncharacterized protein sS8_2531 [Methylocaldum marinum]
MPDFNLMAATRTIEKSMPFVLYRLLMCLAIAFAYVVITAAGAGTAIGLSSLSQNPTAFASAGAIAGFIGCAFLMYKLRPTFLYNIKAGNLALLAEQHKGNAIPEGRAQIDYAKQIVGRRFPSASGLMGLDRSIEQTLQKLPEAGLASTLSKLNNPWFSGALSRLAGRLYAANHQTVLVWLFLTDDDDPWRSARNALAAHVQYFSSIFKSRVYLGLFELLGFASGFALLLIPIRNIASTLPVSIGLWQYVFTAAFAWSLKAAFFEPIAQAAMAQTVFKLIGQGINPDSKTELDRKAPMFSQRSS